MDVQVKSVLDRFWVWDDLKPNAGTVTIRITDPVHSLPEIFFGHSQAAIEVLPGRISVRYRGQLVGQGIRPEPSKHVRVGAVDDQLKANRHRRPPTLEQFPMLPDSSAHT